MEPLSTPSSPETIFNAHAPRYRDVHNSNLSKLGFDSFYMSEQKVRLLADLKLPAVQSILDVGCGDGGMALDFRKYFPKARITGVDIAQASVELARERHLPNCEFLHTDGKSLPFPDGQFDLVVIAGVLMHVPHANQLEYLREAYRVLRPGGTLTVFEHNPYNPVTRRLVKICPFDDHAVLNTAPRIRGLLQQLGAIDPRVRYYLYFPKVSVFQYLIPFEKQLGWLPLGGQYQLAIRKPPIPTGPIR
jgi:ubiquinone/menaquinone biosynthesis C-methylase UbiE